MEAETFKSRKTALQWLRERGHQVSQGKFYQDCAAGFPLVNKDKTVSKFQVAMYAEKLTKATLPDKPMSSQEDDMRKARADADMAEIKAERMRREEDAYWLHADRAWGIMAGLIGTLRDSIRHHLYTGQAEMTHVAGGEQERSQELFEYADGLIDKAFNEVAGREIRVEFVKEDKA